MKRIVITSLFIFIASIALAQNTNHNALIERLNRAENTAPTAQSNVRTNQEETTYIRPMPFSLFADSPQYATQRMYEILPKVNDISNIPGTKSLVDIEIKKLLSGSITWGGNFPPMWEGSNITPIGSHEIEVRNLGSDYYFWCVYGKVQFFAKERFNPRFVPVRTVQNYFIVLHFNRNNSNAIVDYFYIGNVIVRNNAQTLNHISKEATTLLTKANQEAYEKVNSKNEWTINNRAVTGQFDSYRNGRVTLMRNNARTTFNVNEFSYNEQMLIRGYIDHQGISIRDVPSPGRQ